MGAHALSLALLLLVGCGADTPKVALERTASGVVVRADGPIQRVTVRDASGALLVRREGAGAAELRLVLPALSGPALEVETWVGGVATRGQVGAAPAAELAVRAEAQGHGPIAVSGAWPADTSGALDLRQERDVLRLPSANWERVLRLAGLGRVQDGRVAVAQERVVLSGDGPRDVAVHVQTLLPNGQVDPVFRPQFRDGRVLEETAVFARLPASGELVLTVPVWVDRGALSADLHEAVRVIRVVDLKGEALGSSRRAVYLRRGEGFGGGVLAATLLLALSGWALWAARWRAWLSAMRTVDLVTVALFSSLSFVASAAGQLVALSVGALLGPFGPFLTGWLEQGLRTTVLAVLIAWVPRPGTLSLAILVGWVLAAVVLGSAHPAHLLYVGSAMALHEGLAWAAGLTRGEPWTRLPLREAWLRLSVAFGLAQVVGMLAAVAVSAVLYRLWYSPAYVGALALGPGGLYVVAGAWLAAKIGPRLRAVAP